LKTSIRIKQKRKQCWPDIIWLVLIIAVAVALRVAWQYKFIFVGDHVIFREADPYLHMRLAENIVANFPHHMSWDNYALFPNGAPTYSPVLAYLISGVSMIVGLGHPSVHLVDTIGAFTPVALMVIVCVIVYFMGRIIFHSRVTGLIAAMIISVVPSELFHRSLLGFTDHHMLEVVLVTSGLLLLIVALQRRHYAWFLVSGVVFLVYALAWVGWELQVGIIGGWAIGYFVIKVWKRNKRKERIAIILALTAAVVICAALPITRKLFMIFLSNTFLGFMGTIQEVKPVTLYDYYILYGLSGFLAFIGMAVAVKKKINSLFMVWGIFFIVAMIAERRWGYYGVIPIALFTGYLISWVLTQVKADWRGYILTYLCIILLVTTSAYSLGIAKRGNDISYNWYNTCQWLKSNTPEPFEVDDSYNKLDPGKPIYGVFSWWDYGHYIIQIAHRVPVCSPTQQESDYYAFFTATDEQEANNILKNVPGYVVIDEYMINEKFYAIWGKVNGSPVGWEVRLPQSMIYKMYNGQSKTWVLIHQEGDVKVFERKRGG
jgi:asparagine N-glycosylation enzyme membrane subunit Stt3